MGQRRHPRLLAVWLGVSTMQGMHEKGENHCSRDGVQEIDYHLVLRSTAVDSLTV